MSKTPVTHGRMYRWKIWKIVSDLRIIIFIRESGETLFVSHLSHVIEICLVLS